MKKSENHGIANLIRNPQKQKNQKNSRRQACSDFSCKSRSLGDLFAWAGEGGEIWQSAGEFSEAPTDPSVQTNRVQSAPFPICCLHAAAACIKALQLRSTVSIFILYSTTSLSRSACKSCQRRELLAHCLSFAALKTLVGIPLSSTHPQLSFKIHYPEAAHYGLMIITIFLPFSHACDLISLPWPRPSSLPP